MSPRAFKPEPDRPAKTEDVRRGLLEEVIWGRPVFRPPQLPNPELAVESLPLRSHSFAVRPTAAR